MHSNYWYQGYSSAEFCKQNLMAPIKAPRTAAAIYQNRLLEDFRGMLNICTSNDLIIFLMLLLHY